MGYREYVEKGPMPSRDDMKNFLRSKISFSRRYEMVDLYQAAGKVAAEDIKAKTVLPKQPVSKMDGIGVRFADFAGGMPDTTAWMEGREYVFANTGCVVPAGYEVYFQKVVPVGTGYEAVI